jgi:hypothetical protein
MTAKGITIALSGKGGVGKTFISSMLVKRLSEHGSVLAIDADPDSNLPQALGVNVTKTVGQSREDIINAPMRSPVTNAKQEYLEQSIHQSIEEFPRFSIIVMGRSEGEGCYCAVNHVIRGVIDTRARGYDFTVIDCPAGLEHLSRRPTRDQELDPDRQAGDGNREGAAHPVRCHIRGGQPRHAGEQATRGRTGQGERVGDHGLPPLRASGAAI